MVPEPIQVVMIVVRALDRLGVPYLIGGSFASSVHGIPRATMDADLVADMSPQDVKPFVAELKPAFYVDEEMVRSAIESGRSFNVIHLESMFKVDIFILGDRPRRAGGIGLLCHAGGCYFEQAGVVPRGRMCFRSPVAGCPRRIESPEKPFGRSVPQTVDS
ncbi:MAG: hypothetical protein ACUVXI_04385 [bacterium]